MQSRTTFALAVSVSAGLCVGSIAAQSWTLDPSNGHFYALTPPLTWQAARAQAQAWGGELATVRDAGEQNFLWSTFSGSNQTLWIGCTDETTSVWHWVSGEPFSYTDWCAGQPSNTGGTEHYGQMWGACGGQWNDADNGAIWPGIVELTLASVLPQSATTNEGNISYDGFPRLPSSRTQVLMEAAGFGTQPTSGLVTALELRRDDGTSTLNPGVVTMELEIGTAGLAAETMSTTFQSNWGGRRQIVFPMGSFSVPGQPPASSGPAPFSIRIPFNPPFQWNGEDLVYEIRVTSSTLTTPYEIDAVAQAYPAGSVTRIGHACAAPSGLVPVVVPPAVSTLLPGKRMTLTLQNATPFAFCINYFGSNTSVFNGVPLPFTWPTTNCVMYTGAALPISNAVDASGSVSFIYDLNLPQVAGLSAYTQFAVLEGPSAYPPVTFSEALHLTVGGLPTATYQTVAAPSQAPVGVTAPGLYTAPVTRLVQ